jgi:hypothetical protein
MKSDGGLLSIMKMKMTFEECSCLIINMKLESINIRIWKNQIFDLKHPDLLRKG